MGSTGGGAGEGVGEEAGGGVGVGDGSAQAIKSDTVVSTKIRQMIKDKVNFFLCFT